MVDITKYYLDGDDENSDEGDDDRLTKKWTDGSRIDHNFNKETEYMNLLREENKVIDIA